MVACGSLAGFIPGVQAADVRILPVDNAKFLAGAKFDFDIEVSKAKNLKNVDITVNGQKADKFFGQKLDAKDLGNGVISYRANQVNFPKSATVVTGHNLITLFAEILSSQSLSPGAQ